MHILEEIYLTYPTLLVKCDDSNKEIEAIYYLDKAIKII